MSQENLDLLIQLVNSQTGEEYDELKDYLHLVKKNYNTLYSVHIDGAICTQRHLSTF